MRIAFWLLFAALTAAGSPALACSMYAELKVADIRRSEIVVVGTLTDYRIASGGSPQAPFDYAIFTVQTQRTLKGKAARSVRFSWVNSTFGLPTGMQVGAKVVVAGWAPPAVQTPLRGRMLEVLQAPCSQAFIFTYSPRLETDLTKVLRGGSVKNISYAFADENLFIWKH